MQSNSGWVFEDHPEKPGLWGNASTSELQVAIDVHPPVTIFKVFHLQSWLPEMGTASVECLPSVCACELTTLNGKGGEHTVMVPSDVPITVSGPGSCLLRFRGQTGSFKLMGVALSQMAHSFEGASME